MIEQAIVGDPATWQAMVAAWRPDVLERARSSFALAWFPMADHMHLCDVVYDLVGRAGFVALFRRAFATTIQTPMLGGLFGMIGRMSDDPVVALLRNVPRLYHHMTRDVGTVTAEFPGPNDARLQVHDYPAHVHRFDVWLAGTEACILGGISGIDPDAIPAVAIEHQDESRGRGVYRVRW